jgi:hypothetical protein
MGVPDLEEIKAKQEDLFAFVEPRGEHMPKEKPVVADSQVKDLFG